MQRLELGKTGLEVPRIVLGCGNFGGIGSAPDLFGQGEGEEEAFRIMDAAWEQEVTAFDTADAYGGGASETAIGKWIASRGHRPFLTTKTFAPMTAGADQGLAPERITRQLESSLDRLGVDHVDVYLAHAFDSNTPVEDSVSAFESLIELGLIKAYGVSNVSAEELRAFLRAGRPSVVQNSYSLLDRGDEQEILPLCTEFDLAYTPFSPLAGGWLTGKYRRGEPVPAGSRMSLRPGPYQQLLNDRTFDVLEQFSELAARLGTDTTTLAIAWLLARTEVTAVVVGPRNPEQLQPALRALELQLSADEREELTELFETS
jgi:aryl-alcohol dehydrogenase-like predicted oxidoreductase